MDFLFLFFAIIVFSIQIIFTKKYQTESTGGIYAGAMFSLMYGIALGIAFLFLSSFKINFSTTAIIWALVYSISAVLCQICTILAMYKGSISVVSMFMLSGGLILPFFSGVLFWNENMGVVKILGCVLIFFPFIYQNTNYKDNEIKRHKGFIPLCVVVFITNGLISIASKAHQVSINRISTKNYLFICNCFTAFISLFVVLFCKIKYRESNENQHFFKLKYIVYVLGYATLNGIGNFFSLSAAKTLDASIQFPILSAAIVCISSFLAYLIFKEKLSKRDVIALLINSVGIISFFFTI